MSDARAPVAEIGDFLPDFHLTDQRPKELALLHYARGKPLVALVSRARSQAELAPILCDFAEAEPELGPRAHIFAITGAEVEANVQMAAALGLPFPLLSQPDQGVADALGLPRNGGAAAGVTCVIADANRRILRKDHGLAAAGHAAEVRRYLDAQPCESAREVGPLAPVLTVPRVFDPAFCQRLITLYETGDHAATGVFRGEDRPLGGQLDSQMKNRSDHVVQDPAINNAIGGLIGRRVVPEIFKAFSFRVRYVKEFKIGCYEADAGGFFRPHRDNIEPVGGRRFAMSLNLNTGDYEGGYLRFPEYGPHLYRPAAGDAVIFSCTLTHEATPVTAGRRFVLLSFFYGDEGD